MRLLVENVDAAIDFAAVVVVVVVVVVVEIANYYEAVVANERDSYDAAMVFCHDDAGDGCQVDDYSKLLTV